MLHWWCDFINEKWTKMSELTLTHLTRIWGPYKMALEMPGGTLLSSWEQNMIPPQIADRAVFSSNIFSVVIFSAILKKFVDYWVNHVGKLKCLLQHVILEYSQSFSREQWVSPTSSYLQSCILWAHVLRRVPVSCHSSCHLPAMFSLSSTCETVLRNKIYSLFNVCLLHPVVTKYSADIWW